MVVLVHWLILIFYKFPNDVKCALFFIRVLGVIRLIPNELYRVSVQRLRQLNMLFTNKLETVDLYFVYINRIDLVQNRDAKYSLSFISLSYPNLA